MKNIKKDQILNELEKTANMIHEIWEKVDKENEEDNAINDPMYDDVEGWVNDLLDDPHKPINFTQIAQFINKENMEYFDFVMKGGNGARNLLRIAVVCIIEAFNIQKL